MTSLPQTPRMRPSARRQAAQVEQARAQQKAEQLARLTPTALLGARAVLDSWELSDEVQTRLIYGDQGASPQTYRAQLERARGGGKVASLSDDQMQRCSRLIRTAHLLTGLYPEAHQRMWVHLPSQAAPFFGRTPLEHMLQGGFQGLSDVHAHLMGRTL